MYVLIFFAFVVLSHSLDVPDLVFSELEILDNDDDNETDYFASVLAHCVIYPV